MVEVVSDMERERRANAGKRTKSSSLAAIKEARAGGVRRSEQFQVRDDTKIYDEVDEEEYKKREGAGDWVVNDGVGGYREDDEESEEYYSDEADAAERKRPAKKPKVSKKVTKQRVAAAFLGGGNSFASSVGPNKKGDKNDIDTSKGDDFLNNLLNDLHENADDDEDEVAFAPQRQSINVHHQQRRILPVDPGNVPKKKTEDPYSVLPPSDGKERSLKKKPKVEDAFAKELNAPAEEPAPEPVVEKEESRIVSEDDEVVEEKEKLVVVTPKVADVPAKKPAPLPEIKADSSAQWWSVCEDDKEEEVDIQAAAASANTKLHVQQDGSVNFYWTDATEDRDTSPGTVFLFGKVQNKEAKSHSSCCVAVNNIPRCLYFLPRARTLVDGHETGDEVSMADVYQEVSFIMNRYKITGWRSKPMDRKYSFELADIPAESQYLYVEYGANFPAIPPETTGKTFSHVFGARTNCLETFLLNRNIMGPCWLKVKAFEENKLQISWCKFEVSCKKMASIDRLDITENVPENPPLTVMSISTKTVQPAKAHTNELVMVSAIVHNEVNMDGPTLEPRKKYQHFTLLRRLPECTILASDLTAAIERQKKKAQCLPNERALLSLLMGKIHQIDPDVIIGHNVIGFDLDVLLHRLQHHKMTQHWSKLGRLRRHVMPKLNAGTGDSSFAVRQATGGRLICDTYLSSKELLHEKQYSLTNLAATQLGYTRNEIDFQQIPDYFQSLDRLFYLVDYNEKDAGLAIGLMFTLNVLPLSKQLTALSGYLWARSLTGSRAERVEFLLLHEFTKRGYIVPDKETTRERKANLAKEEGHDVDDAAPTTKGRRKPAYSGGLVLEPKKGLYDTFVVMLDFNSLYPSIIQEYNICFTTVERPEKLEDGTYETPEVPPSDAPTGVLPTVIRTLVERRRQVKALMKAEKDPHKYQQLDIRQKALKLTANSMYGCLGFTYSRFFARPIAELITYKGREILQHTVDLAQDNLGLNVIYGDTDSIMINTSVAPSKDEPLKETLGKVKAIGGMVKKEVNKLYNKLEIELDGIFKSMLLLKKKKYAALIVDESSDPPTLKEEMKGLDLVRRDWCELSRDVGRYVLAQVLSGMPKDDVVANIHDHLSKTADEVRSGDKAIRKFIVTKGLTKNPEEYPDAKNQPHVTVALRMRKQGKPVQVGMHIEYVICVDPDNNGKKGGVAERARHPTEVASGEAKIDYEWYLANQLHPPVSRLCAPIEGTNAAQLAECLGLDASKFVERVSHDDMSENVDLGHDDPDEKYKHCERLSIRCRKCKTEADFQGVHTWKNLKDDSGNLITPKEAIKCGLLCPSCSGHYSYVTLVNKIALKIHNYIHKYYEGWMVCDEVSCRNRTRQLSLRNAKACLVTGCRGTMHEEYSAKELHLQIKYFQNLVDMKAAEERSKAIQTKNSSIIFKAVTADERKCFDKLKERVNKVLSTSAYHRIDGSFFALACGQDIKSEK